MIEDNIFKIANFWSGDKLNFGGGDDDDDGEDDGEDEVEEEVPRGCVEPFVEEVERFAVDDDELFRSSPITILKPAKNRNAER